MYTSPAHCHASEPERRDDALRADLHALATISLINTELAAQIIEAKKGRSNIVKLTQRLVADAEWPQESHLSGSKSFEYYSLCI